MTTMKQMQAAAKWDTGTDRPEAKPPVAGSATGSAKWSKEELSWLLGEIELNSKLKEADNRKLLWLAMNTRPWKERDMIGVETEILNEVENRLYPEYDGETVTFEEWGWKTPDGEIRYLPNTS